MTNFITSEIDAGRPVLVACYKDSTKLDGHAMIAYSYKIVNNKTVIYYNSGWGYNYYFDGDGYFPYEAYSLVYEGDHKCSNNYYVNELSKTLCPCEFYDEYESHNHNYTYKYNQYTKTMHLAYCLCGKNKKQVHTLVSSTCDLCGYKSSGGVL